MHSLQMHYDEHQRFFMFLGQPRFTMAFSSDAKASGSSKRLFDQLSAYRAREGVEDAVHSSVMEKLSINQEAPVHQMQSNWVQMHKRLGESY